VPTGQPRSGPIQAILPFSTATAAFAIVP